MFDVDLLENLDNDSVIKILQCIGIKTKTYSKGSNILKIGSKIDFLGVILEGKAQISKPDIYGNHVVIEKIKENDIFGHNIVCLGINISPVDIIAVDKCKILLLPFEKIVTPCAELCKAHITLIKNVMKMISKRNSLLDDKIDIIGRKTIRDKVMLLLERYKNSDGTVLLPYSREEMARFLCTDRCALSRELSRMQKDGIINYKRNSFKICSKEI